MNISFEISKVNDNYRLKFLMFNHRFIEFLENRKIIHILFNDKKIKIPNYTGWYECSVSNDKFSFYVSDSWRNNTYNSTDIIKECDDSKESNQYVMICFNVGYDQIIKSDIENFDIIFIKAMRILSDTYNNYIKDQLKAI